MGEGGLAFNLIQRVVRAVPDTAMLAQSRRKELIRRVRWQQPEAGEASPVRVAFVNTHPIQYFAPLYAELNRSDDLSITALYLSDYSVRGATDGGFGHIVKWDVDLL